MAARHTEQKHVDAVRVCRKHNGGDSCRLLRFDSFLHVEVLRTSEVLVKAETLSVRKGADVQFDTFRWEFKKFHALFF